MAGFNKEKLIEAIQLSDNQNPLWIIALGYLNDAEKLEEHFKAREFTARKRRLLAEMVKELWVLNQCRLLKRTYILIVSIGISIDFGETLPSSSGEGLGMRF